MSTTFESRYASSPAEVKQMDTAQLRQAFLIEKIFEADHIGWNRQDVVANDDFISVRAVGVSAPRNQRTKQTSANIHGNRE